MSRPPGPDPQQMLRVLPSIRRFAPDVLVSLAQQYGDMVSLPVPRHAVFLAASPQAAADILVTDPHAWERQTPQYLSLNRLTGAGLLTSDGDAWRRHRRLLAPVYSRGGLPLVRESAARAARLVDLPHGSVDIQSMFGLLSLEILGAAVLHTDLQDRARELVHNVEIALATVIADVELPQPVPPGLPTPRRRRLRLAQTTLDRAAAELLQARRQLGLGERDDLLGVLVRAVDSGAMSAQQARDELVTTVVAGHETVASALTWTLWLLAEHPAWQERARHDEGVVAAVVAEGLRLHPPAWVMSRRSVRATTVAGWAIPAGAFAIISPWQLHRRPEVFPQPEDFDPERFLTGRPPRHGYLPFGAGARLCIGRDVALVEAATVLSTLLQRARFTPGRPPVPRAGVTVTSRGGLWVTSHPNA